MVVAPLPKTGKADNASLCEMAQPENFYFEWTRFHNQNRSRFRIGGLLSASLMFGRGRPGLLFRVGSLRI